MECLQSVAVRLDWLDIPLPTVFSSQRREVVLALSSARDKPLTQMSAAVEFEVLTVPHLWASGSLPVK